MDNINLPMTETTIVDEENLPQPIPGNPTIAEFFESEINNLTNQETLEDIRQKLEDEDKSVRVLSGVFNQKFYEKVFQFVFQKLQQMITIDIPRDVLAQSWSKYTALQDYLDEVKYPPDQLFKAVLMMEQTIHAKYNISFKPAVKIMGKNFVLNQFSFPIALELLVKAGELGIQGGKIVSLSVGSCHVKGEMKCKYGNGMERLLVKQDKNLDLSRQYQFKEGVPIKLLNKDELLAKAAEKTDLMVQNLAQDLTENAVVAEALTKGRTIVKAIDQAGAVVSALEKDVAKGIEKGSDLVQAIESGDVLAKVIENREAIAAALGQEELINQALTQGQKIKEVADQVTDKADVVVSALEKGIEKGIEKGVEKSSDLVQAIESNEVLAKVMEE
ncbi:MAG: hypothetical protein ACK5QS_00995 [Pseudanabaenaceae cyanobacterium]